MKSELGDLDKIKRVIRLFGMVNSTPDFGEPPKVVDGASDLLFELFGSESGWKMSTGGVDNSVLPPYGSSPLLGVVAVAGICNRGRQSSSWRMIFSYECRSHSTVIAGTE